MTLSLAPTRVAFRQGRDKPALTRWKTIWFHQIPGCPSQSHAKPWLCLSLVKSLPFGSLSSSLPSSTITLSDFSALCRKPLQNTGPSAWHPCLQRPPPSLQLSHLMPGLTLRSDHHPSYSIWTRFSDSLLSNTLLTHPVLSLSYSQYISSLSL